MKITQNKWFWILQIFGWGVVASTNVWAKLVFKKELNSLYIYTEGFLFFSAGIISTLIIRKYLKRKLAFDKFQSKEIKAVLIALVMGSLLLFAFLMFSIPLYKFFHTKEHAISSLELITTLINSFIFILFWLLLYISIKISRRFRRDRIERLELEASLKESQLNTLKGQINPHFMFNSLNNIRGLMLEDVEKSREMITRLSEMLRYSLTKNEVDTIAIKDELEMVDNFIALSKIQLEDRLQYHQKIDADLIAFEIPPMLIQMLIENAIKHGISKQQKGGKVTLSISKETKNLMIQVRNTGKLTAQKSSTKVGLENIKKRILLLYGPQADFSLREIENEVVAIIKIPL